MIYYCHPLIIWHHLSPHYLIIWYHPCHHLIPAACNPRFHLQLTGRPGFKTSLTGPVIRWSWSSTLWCIRMIMMVVVLLVYCHNDTDDGGGHQVHSQRRARALRQRQRSEVVFLSMSSSLSNIHACAPPIFSLNPSYGGQGYPCKRKILSLILNVISSTFQI